MIDCMLVKIVFSLRLRNRIQDPWLLFRQRRGFQDAVIARCCGSLDRQTPGTACACRRGLQQELSHDPDVVRRHQKPGHPFVLTFPMLAPEQMEATVSLVLIGDAIGDLPVYIGAVRQFVGGQSTAIHADITSIHSEDFYGNRTELLGDRRMVDQSVALIAMNDLLQDRPAHDHVTIRLDSPLRLFSDGLPVTAFDFPLFLRSQLRRISALAAYYGGSAPDLDFRSLSTTAGDVRPVSSSLVEVVIPGTRISGLTGRISVAGRLDDLYPILRLGELLHVGKGASFGFGAFSLDSSS